MARCDYCGAEVDLPFKCKYCGGTFCVKHHLPENHNCPGLRRRAGGKWFEVPLYEEPRETIRVPPRPVAPLTVSAAEGKDLALATFSVFLVFLSYFNWPLRPLPLVYLLALTLLTYLTHELAHKLLATYYGYPARFVLSREGFLATLVTALLPIPIKVVAPGTVVVEGVLSRYKLGVIALAGPLTNVAIALLARFAAYAVPPFSHYLYGVADVSAWIALFNLIPLPTFDGSKVIRWSAAAWLSIVIAALALWLL